MTVTRITSNRIAGLRLLVVDDSDINREVAKRILESEGAIVTLAHDGQYALDWLLAHENVVDLVLMDIQMPRLDGYAATQKIRMHPKFSQLPILALTAGAFKSLQEAALEAGMNDFIAKPFNVDLMIGKIRHWTGHVLLPETPYQTPLVSTDSTGLSMLEPTTAKPDDSLPTLPGIDLAAGLKIWGDIKDLQTYLVRFLQQYQAAGHEIRAFFEQGNSAAIGTLAHKMKGAAFSVAATPIADLCRQIEECLNTPAELSQATDHLQAALDELQQALDTWLPVHHGPTPGVLDQQAIHDRWPTIAPMITELLQALDEDNPSHAEDILSQLERQLDSHYLNPIKAALTEFDFREAESLVRMLIGTFAP